MSISAKLTADNAERYVVSIRLRSGGLSFTGYDSSTSDSFFYQEVEFDRSRPYITSLKDYFFDNECLGWPFKRFFIVCVSPKYILMPAVAFRDDQKDKLLAFAFSADLGHGLYNELKDKETYLLFPLEEETYEFCSRSIINPVFFHYMTPQLNWWKKQSRNFLPRLLYVVLHSEWIDVACFCQGVLQFSNSFVHEQAEDILYYILYVWKQTGLNQETDRLRIYGEPTLRARVADALHQYIQYIDLLDIPSEAYLLGLEVRKAPLDIITLLLCE
ncbi:MAG: DUF3822 family protein [Parabacteroides sp.]|nr:DUF3822 family protein [Parabacteroides sp.]